MDGYSIPAFWGIEVNSVQKEDEGVCANPMAEPKPPKEAEKVPLSWGLSAGMKRTCLGDSLWASSLMRE